jgi:autotransporter-associated beta strand protein
VMLLLLHDTNGPTTDGGLTKVGAGRLILSGSATFNGPVAVSNGTLEAWSAFGSTLVVRPGATLTLGTAAIEDLAVAGDVTLQGTVVMKIDRSGAFSTADLISGIDTLTMGGTLVVQNIGAAPQYSDVFLLFDAQNSSGAFSSIVLPPLDAGLAWDTAFLEFGILYVQHAPVAVNDNISALANTATNVLHAVLTANDSDADSDPLTISSVSSNSTMGGTVVLGGSVVTYIPPTNSVGQDTFTYVITDGRGGYATGTVAVAIGIAGQATGGGTVQVTATTATVGFQGTPNVTYNIDRSLIMPATNWVFIGTAIADNQGRIIFTDTNRPAGQAFYRTRR